MKMKDRSGKRSEAESSGVNVDGKTALFAVSALAPVLPGIWGACKRFGIHPAIPLLGLLAGLVIELMRQ